MFKTRSDVTSPFKEILSPLGNAISPAKLSYSLNTSSGEIGVGTTR